MKNWIIYFSLALISGYGREEILEAAESKSLSSLVIPTPSRTVSKNRSSAMGKLPVNSGSRRIDVSETLETNPLKTESSQGQSESSDQRSEHGSKRGSAKPSLDGFKGYFSKIDPKEQLTAKEKADVIRQTAIKTITDILKTSKPQGSRKFELTLRLAEMYLERHDYLREIEIESFQKRWDEWQNSKSSALSAQSSTSQPSNKLTSESDTQKSALNSKANDKEPALNHTPSKNHLRTAINILRSLVTEFPNHQKTSTALYVLGQSLLLDHNDMAETYLVRLTKSFPHSEDFPEACLALGEFYFERNLMPKAEEFYKKALAFRNHKAFTYALYKYSWTLYNLAYVQEQESAKLFEKSLASMKMVIKLTEKDRSNARNLNLREEAINDLVVIWADVGNVDDAPAYFKSINASHKFYDLLERLAGIYSDQGKKSESLALYQRILSESALRKRNFEVYKKMVLLAEDGVELNRISDTLRNMNAFVKQGSAWNKARDPKDIPAILSETEALTKYYGTKFHQISQKSNNLSYAKAAASIYETYMTFFPDGKSGYEVRYYYADLLFTLGVYGEAAKQFLKVSQSKESAKYRYDASTSAVASAEENLDKLGLDDKNLTPSARSLDLPQPRLLWKEVVENFLLIFPKDQQSPNMMIALASTLFRYGHQLEAIAWYEKLAQSFPSSREGKQAMQFIVVYYLEQKNYDKAYEMAGTYKKNPETVNDAELMSFLSKRIREAAFGKGLLLEEKKKYLEAADHFSSFQKNYASDEMADKALYNAIGNYLKSGAIKNVISASETLIKTYPSSKLRADVMASLAETEQAIGDFEDARKAYLSFASSYPQESRSKIALINAARLARGLGKIDAARSSYLAVARSYPADPIIPELILELALMLERSGSNKDQAKEAWKILSEKANSSKELTETSLTAEAYLISYAEKPRVATRELSQKLRSSKLPAMSARQIVGGYLFQGLQGDFEAFMRNQHLDSKNLELSISAKNEKLIQLTKQLMKIAEVAGTESALRVQIMIGDLHKSFSDSLMKVELDPDLASDNRDAIKNDLEKLAQPLNEQAYTFYQNAWQIAEDLPIFTEWSKTAYDRMGMVNPEKFKAIVLDTMEPDYLSHRIRLNQETKDLGI